MGVDSQLILMGRNDAVENDTGKNILTDVLYLAGLFQKAAYDFNVRQMYKALFASNSTPSTDKDINPTLRYVLKCVDYEKPYVVPFTFSGSPDNSFAIAPLYLLDINTGIQRDFLRDVFRFVENGGVHTMLNSSVSYPDTPTDKYLHELAKLMHKSGLPDYTNAANPFEVRSLQCRVGESISHFFVDTGILNGEQNTKFLKKHTIASVHFNATDLGITFLNYVRENPLSYQPYTTFFNPYDTVPFSDVLDNVIENVINSDAYSILKNYRTNGFTPSKRAKC